MLGSAAGLFLPSRYLWPNELLALPALAYALPAAWQGLRRRAKA